MIHLQIRSLAMISALALAACGTPQGLDQATMRFSEATAATEAALADLDRTVSLRLTRQRRADAIRGQAPDPNDPTTSVGTGVFEKRKERVETATGVEERDIRLCSPDSPGCELHLQYGTDGPLVPIVVDSVLPNQRRIAEEIRLYAEGLAAISAADETEKVKAGFARAMAGACGLANVVQSGVGPACQAFAAPVGNLVAFVYGEYQERVKLVALRKATATMNPVIDRAKTIFSETTEFAALPELVDLEKDVSVAQRTWVGSRSEANLESYLRAAATLDQALVAVRGEVFIELATAHDGLTALLQDREKNLPEVLAQLKTLVDKAKRLRTIAKDLREAAESL